MRVLVDTDVLMDVVLDRTPWAEASGAVLDLCAAGTLDGFLAWHSASNLYYYARARHDKDAKAFLADLLQHVQVAPVGTEDLVFALKQPMADFEDAMQVAAAVACRAERIVTRNTKDFSKPLVPAVTPADLLRELEKAS